MTTTTNTAAATAAASMRASPWQYEWKRPQWHKPQQSTENDNDKNDNNDAVHGVPLATASAEVQPHECSHLLLQSGSGGRGGLWQQQQQHDHLLSSSFFVLSVTLYATHNQKNRRRSGGGDGDIVVLELIRQDRMGDVSSRVQSRVLRWPSSALVVMKEEEEEEEEEPTMRQDHHHAHWPWWGNQQKKTKKKHEASSAVGLVSLSLCRRPTLYQQDDDAAAAAAMASVDALEVLQLMSLGLGGVGAESWSSPPPPTTTKETVEDKNLSERPDASPSELILACLASNGTVHMYEPLSILTDGGQEENVDEKQDLMSGFSSLLFGENIYHELQKSVLPLSHPIASVTLSVPLQKHSLDSRALPTESKPPPPPSESIETHLEKEEDEDDRLEELAVWDNSLWDANVEHSTAVHSTRQNVPTIVTPAFGYVAIGGHGMRLRRRLRRRRKRMKSQKRDDASPSMTTTATANAAAAAGGTTDEAVQAADAPSLETRTAQGEEHDGDPSRGTKFHWVEHHETGGFVTLISLRHFSEARTIYLPFAPKQLSPIVWGGMCFLVVLGDENTAPIHAPMATLIRVDASNVLRIPLGEAPFPLLSSMESDLSGSSSLERVDKKQPMCSIRRFRPIPIVLEAEDSKTTIVSIASSTLFTSPPCLALMYASKTDSTLNAIVAVKTLAHFDLVPFERAQRALGGHRHFGKAPRMALAVTTRQHPGHAAQIPHRQGTSELTNISCSIGQGWMLVGLPRRVFFVCLEGATATEGSFVAEIYSDEQVCDADESNVAAPLLSTIIPMHAFDGTPSTLRFNEAFDENELYKSTSSLRLPFTSPYKVPSIIRDANKMPEEPPAYGIDRIVVDALDSISTVRFDESTVQKSRKSKRGGTLSLSHRQKSERLLRHCTSWTLLDDKEGGKVLLDGQVPVLTGRIGSRSNELFLLSLRQIVVDNGIATPFDQVLAWLSQSEEYYTAASVALDLLRDVDTLRDLRRTTDATEYDTDRTTIEGLLDGIIPLYQDDPDDKSEKQMILPPSQSVLTQLADMTVGCLTRGGLDMSTTLENFVRRDKNYDPARACLMLVAAAAFCVSDDKESIKSIMGVGYEWPSAGEPAIDDILWPMRCLLKLAVSRDYLETTLLLINAAIPNEMRRQVRRGERKSTLPSMELCRSLVAMIVASASEAAELLLNLKDDETNSRYWLSLDHETQLELSLISINGAFPMLRQAEIRRWALDLLERGIREVSTSEEKAQVGSISEKFLKELCHACLCNAGCDPEDFRQNLTPSAKDSAAIKEKQDGSDTVITKTRSEEDEVDGSHMHIEEQRRTQRALTASPGHGGLDFDLLIPSLLLLRHQGSQWQKDTSVSTQTVLDAACYLAGRHTVEEPMFVFDSRTVMRQCALAGNVSAGANLIGGRDGMILKCCDILIHGANMNMDDAEAFILKDKLSGSMAFRTAKRSNKDADIGNFALTDGHRHVLWLFDEHVLHVRTFGEFETTHIRGKVDPVFAARACLRTWWRLSPQDPSAPAWLVTWLRQRLGMTPDQVSPKRLACAALARALLWPTSEHVVDVGELDAKSDEILANAMNIESNFLVQLCQSCCGLIESIPPSLAEEMLREEPSSTSSSSGNLSSSRPLQVDV